MWPGSQASKTKAWDSVLGSTAVIELEQLGGPTLNLWDPLDSCSKMILDAYRGNLGGKAARSLQSISRIFRERSGLVDLMLGGLCYLLAE